jgi:PAS domain S-box-containing protein
MKDVSQISQTPVSLRWSYYLIIGIVTVAILVLLGWQFDITSLRRPFPGLVSMNPLTAVLFILLCISFLSVAFADNVRWRKIIGYFLACCVIALSLTKILFVAGVFSFEIDQALYTEKIKTDIVNNLPNSMAPNTAFCFVLAGCAVVLLNYQTANGRMPAQYLVLINILAGLLSILGYIYGVKYFYGVLNYIPMAFHSALCFSAFSFAVFLRHSTEGIMKELTGTYTGSVAAKILIPVAVFVPALLGLIRVHAERHGLVSFEFGTAVLVLSTILVFLVVIWYVTVLLNRKDKLRIIAEKELKASRKQLEKLNEELEGKIRMKTIEIRETFERVSDVFYALDADERFTFVNNKAASLMKKEVPELLGRRLWDIFSRDNAPREFLNAYDRARQTKEYQTVESFSNLAGRWFNIDLYPSVAGISLFLRDVTDRKKALDAAEKERTLYASIIQSLPGIFYFYDDTGKFLGWNKNFELVSGYSGEEISKMTPDQFFADDEKEYIRSRIGIVFTDGVSDAEANFLSKDGKKTYHYFTGVRLEYEGKPCLMGVGIDISQLKKTEAELRMSEQKYRLLFEWNPMPMWMLSLNESKFIDVNNAAINHYGYSREDFLNKSITFFLAPEELPRLRDAMKDGYKKGTRTTLWKHVKKNGEIISVEITTHDILHDNKPVRLILANDVTEKLKAEKELEQSNEILRQLTSHLQEVREEERRHIAREIHDELGQQLTVIKMDVSWIRKKTSTDNGPVLEKIKELTHILDETVNTVRKISSRLRPSLLDDLGLVAAMEWYLNDFKQRTGIDILFNLPNQELELPDSINTCLFRILQESLTNVARHADAKFVTVTLEDDTVAIKLTIQDDGKGYDVERASGKRTLGIIGMKERAAMIGGKYTIYGKPGEGTLVSIEVPSVQYLSAKSELI